MDTTTRRILLVVLFFLAVGIAWSLWRGDGTGRIVGNALTALAVGGAVIGYHLSSRRKD